MQRIRIALQKSGRLTEKSLSLLEKCGLQFDHGRGALLTPCNNFPLDIMLVRDDDIPEFVRTGTCHLGIVGRNVLEEALGPCSLPDLPDSTVPYKILRTLGFGHCRLSLAFPKDMPYQGLTSLKGMRIATTYPHILGRFLQNHDINATVVTVSGSVEIAPALDLADGICDLVSSGSTLRANGLREFETVMSSECLLVTRAAPARDDHQLTIDRLLQRFDGVQMAAKSKYIMMNAPIDKVEAITRLIPGMEKPTVIPLANGGKHVALHAVAGEEIFWETMEKLKAAGASGILVVPIEKIIG